MIMQSNNNNEEEHQYSNVESSMYDWKDAFKVVEKMVQLGCFTENPLVFSDHDPQQKQQKEEEEHVDDTEERIKSLNEFQFTLEESNIVISHPMEREKACCMTRNYLVKQIETRLVELGRIDLSQLSNEIHIDFKDCLSSAQQLTNEYDQYHLVGEKELLTSGYLDQLCIDLKNSASANNTDKEQMLSQQVPISTLAKEWKLPLSFTIDIITQRMKNILQDWKLVRGIDGSKQLITKYLEEMKLNEIKQILETSAESVHMNILIQNIQFWDMDLAVTFVQGLCESNILNGHLHVHDSSNLGAFYTPQIYEEKQRTSVLEKYSMQGYITYTEGEQLGLSRKGLREIISAGAIFLQELVLNPNVFISSLQLTIEECICSKSYVDLTLHLPRDISEVDSYQFLQEHVLMNTDARKGRLIIHGGVVFYFSEGMIHVIESSILPLLIQTHAKDVALTALSKIKSSKKKSKSFDALITSSDSNVVPLSSFVNAVLCRYPELADHVHVSVLDDNLIWEKTDEDVLCSDGVVILFCRTFMSKELIEECSRWVSREISKSLAVQNGICLHNDDVAFEASEQTFEETFKDSCIFLQLLAKLPHYVCMNSEIEDEFCQALCTDFLNGYASHFARRVTEYCLIKNGIEDSPFSYTTNGDSEDGHQICFNRVDTTVRAFQSNAILCYYDKKMDPNQLLKEMLPGNAAIAIVEMWKIIGKSNPLHGTEKEDIAISDIDAFLTHVEESCLTMVGIPFKRLDKKIEKSILLDRKKKLLTQLDQSTSARDILELSTMLLGNQVRSYALCGNELISSVLDIILKDKKVPENLRQLMKDVAALVQNGTLLSDAGHAKVQRLKECAMSKNMLHSREED